MVVAAGCGLVKVYGLGENFLSFSEESDEQTHSRNRRIRYGRFGAH